MIITTGTKGPVECRKELRVFLQDKDVTNLYILAMDQMMKIKQEDMSSWFQIAAIHGRPYIPFDGVGEKGFNFQGYCCHSSILFPPWHRPYTALFEQSMSKHVHEIANEYKDHADKERYCKAAERFRLPFWDWGLDSTLPDIVATQETVKVHLPNGTHSEIRNPLFGYKFNPVYSDFGDGRPDEKSWESWQTTVRYPTTKDDKAKSSPTEMQNVLKNNRLTLRDRIYNILTQIKDFNAFAHDVSGGADQPPVQLDSIEAIHNQIHGLAGNDGHMGVVDYASFDPVFFLHHANVDRLFAIWQCLNPDIYVTPLKATDGTWTRKPGEIENGDSPLTPFRRTAEKFWTSNEVRDTRVFNYTYPELEKLHSLPKAEAVKRLRVEVHKLYGRTAPVRAAAPSVFKGVPVAAPSPAPAPAKGPSTVTTGPAAHPASNPGTHHETHHATHPATHHETHHAAHPGTHHETHHAVHPGTHHETHHAAHPGTHHETHPVAHPGTHHETHPAAHPATHHDTHHAAHHATHLSGQPTTQPGTTTAPFEYSDAKLPPGHWALTPSTDDDKPHYHEWIANIVIEKYAVKSTCFIHIFLGEFGTDHKKWGQEPNLVGTHVVFTNNIDFTGCGKCKDDHEKRKLVTGTIPLTSCLGTRLGNVAQLEPKIVIPYLQKNLRWRVQKNDKTPVDLKDVPSLKVTVGHCIVEIPESPEHFATWGNIEAHHAVSTHCATAS